MLLVYTMTLCTCIHNTLYNTCYMYVQCGTFIIMVLITTV